MSGHRQQRRRALAVIGDTLLDRDIEGTVERLAPDAPVPVVDEDAVVSRPGGAGLAAVLAAADGRDVTLVTALADDDAGVEVGALLVSAGVEVVALPTERRTAEKVRVRAGGRPLLRLDRGDDRGAAAIVADRRTVAAVIGRASGVLVSDYGRGVAGLTPVRAAVEEAARTRPVVWDPHPRGDNPVGGMRLVTPNRSEAERFTATAAGDSLGTVARQARELAARWRAAGVVITLGPRGALLVEGDTHPMVVPAAPAHGGDPCGAGDRFASAAAGVLADGGLPSEAVVAAVAAASEFVAAGGASSVRAGRSPDAPDPTGPPDAPDPIRSPDAWQVVARTRARDGTVVATGGCFDLLHAGHVAMLRAARALGDCLIVCLNSDASVRRLKGPGRPLVPEEDRTAVLLGLGCVDAVATFDEDTPEAILEDLQPDVWAKGADYAAADLPESSVLDRWSGQVVVLPYLEGRSTSRLLQEVLRRGR